MAVRASGRALALLGILLAGEAAAWGQTADPATALGRLERESVDEALTGLGLTVEPAPAGKVIRRIHVVNQEVFSRRDWWFQWFNHFHRTTRTEVLRRELLVKPGELYDPARVDESVRNLQAPPTMTIGTRTFYPPELSSVVAIVPVKSGTPGQVDLLVVTRDVWSLRFNTNFEFQQNTLALLSTSLSENNLFGWRKYAAFNFTMDQGAMGFGPTYFDPNIRGTRLVLVASATAWYARETQTYEGNSTLLSLRYPLYSLASRWGAGVDVTHHDVVVRSFRGNELWRENVAGPAVGFDDDVFVVQLHQVPHIYRRKTTSVDSSIVRQTGTGVIQRITLGHLFDSRRVAVLPDFPGDAALARRFLDQFAPISEQRSEPYARYEVFTPRYAVFRDLDTFDLRENRRLGPSLAARIAYGTPALGADFAALALRAYTSWSAAWAGGYAEIVGSASGRLRAGTLIDQVLTARVFLASPVIGRALRIVVEAEGAQSRNDTQKTFYFVGGQTGLRGYAIGDFKGRAYATGHIELRSMPLAIFSQRVGALLFYDVGHAAASLGDLVPHHDFGLGLRWLIPQLNSSAVRIDWAFATQSTSFTRPGWPGRITAGFQQVF